MHTQNVRVFNMMKLDSVWKKKVFIKNCTMMNATGAQIRASLRSSSELVVVYLSVVCIFVCQSK